MSPKLRSLKVRAGSAGRVGWSGVFCELMVKAAVAKEMKDKKVEVASRLELA